MARYGTNRILPIILVVVVAIIAIAALISIAQAIFFPGGAPSTTDVSKQALLSTDSNRLVQVTVRGPIVADENFRTYQISVTPNSRSLTTYQGYNKTQLSSINLSNNTQAYEQFVYALDHANLVKGTPLTGDQNDTRGVCATGKIYDFDVLEGTQSIKDLWTSTCSGSKGSLDASLSQLMNLFTTQIPNSQAQINTINL